LKVGARDQPAANSILRSNSQLGPIPLGSGYPVDCEVINGYECMKCDGVDERKWSGWVCKSFAQYEGVRKS